MVNESGYLGSTVGTVLFAALFATAAGANGVPIDMLTHSVFMDGFTVTMVIGAALSLIGAFLSFVVKEIPIGE